LSSLIYLSLNFVGVDVSLCQSSLQSIRTSPQYMAEANTSLSENKQCRGGPGQENENEPRFVDEQDGVLCIDKSDLLI
jgi:hypothetical protein